MIGGKIVKTKPPEIGILNIEMLATHFKDKVFRNFDSTFKVLQWHSYEVQDLESVNDVLLLASSESTKYQIFRYKDYAYGVQFHTEIKEDTISSWGKISELKEVIENNLGKNALHLFEKEGKTHFSVGIGCTGGKHRSVVVATELGKVLKNKGRVAFVKHRDLKIEKR